MAQHSVTKTIAADSGVSERTVQRMVRRAAPDRERTWLTPAHVNSAACVNVLRQGREQCYNHPRRAAQQLIAAGQLSLFA